MPALTLDSGALLFKQQKLPPSRLEPVKATAEGIAQAVQAMDIKAAGIAGQDLTAGPEFLQSLQPSSGITWLSMNIVRLDNSTPLFMPYILVEIAGRQVAVLGLTSETAAKNKKQKTYMVKPWKTVLPQLLTKLENQADMVILLSSYPYQVNEQIARQHDNIHLILQSGHSTANLAPRTINNTLICQTASRGKYLGMMRINWTSSGQWGQDFTTQRKTLQNKVDRINWQMGRMKKRVPAQKLEGNERFQQLVAEKNSMEKEIQALETRQESTKEPCSYSNRFIALKTSLAEDPQIRSIVQQTRREVNKLNRQQLQQEREKRKQKHRDTTTIPQDNGPLATLAGWQACGECHPHQVEFWQTTAHAKAWTTLVERNQQFNRECLPCHVTLPYYDSRRIQEEGLLAHITPELHHVGCESCHGPAKQHRNSPEEVLPVLPDQVTCLNCHTPERDNDFNFERKIKQVGCPETPPS